MIIVGVDRAAREGDWTVETTMRRERDGSVTMLDVQRYRKTIELEKTEYAVQEPGK